MNFTVDYFIAKFEAIPEEQWCSGDYSNSHGQHCAAGHCGEGRFTGVTPESQGLEAILHHRTAYINDGDGSDYKQPTPKQRILAALRDVKAKQEFKP